MDELIQTVRTFNRFYTRVCGVLSEQHLGTGLTLGQARVLFEIGQLGPVEARGLEVHLGLDPGYLSRRLGELEELGLISRKRRAQDQRAKPITLTHKGRQRLALLDRSSDRAASEIVQGLGPKEQEQLQAAMSEIQRLIDDPLSVKAADPQSPEAQACLQAYFAELERRFPGGFDQGRSVRADPEETRPPAGQFLVVYAGSRPRGCGALKTLAPGIGELKRMWIHPELRGRGAGRRLLQALEDEAQALGFDTLRLDTHASLKEAIGLYRGAGYREIPAYNTNRYASLWLEKPLPRGSRTGAQRVKAPRSPTPRRR